MNFLLIILVTFSVQASAESAVSGKIEMISDEVAQTMTGKSWKPNCPVSLEDLRYLTIPYWGYDDQVHEGHMVVHKKVAEEVLVIFAALLEAKFPIENMEIVDKYNADDDLSMEANNSSAFCSRENTTFPGVFSNHSYGIAIDINPKINPYVKGERVCPASGRAYLNRSEPHKGIITEQTTPYYEFTKYGWEWGGNCWSDRVDYQHFSKKISDLS